MSEQELAQEFLNKAREQVDAGDLGAAMETLLEVDGLDGSRAKETTNLRHEIAGMRKEEPSVGTSSLTSESKPDSSGSSTGTDLQWPAPDAESPSDKDQAPKPAPSSVSLTDGSGQGTSYVQVSQPVSSVESVPLSGATADPLSNMSGKDLIVLARHAYSEKNYDAADGYLDLAVAADATLLPDVERYRASIVSARGSQSATSEETPSQGGFAAGGPVV